MDSNSGSRRGSSMAVGVASSRYLVMECGQGGITQRWVSVGLTPGHCFFGSSATVRENSRKILQVTDRVMTPSPHVTLQPLQFPIMNLCVGVIKEH